MYLGDQKRSAAEELRLLNRVSNASSTIALFFSAFELLIGFLSCKSTFDVLVLSGFVKSAQVARGAAAFNHICPLPPSTKSSIPVTKLESSEARNSAALAISSGSPTRPIGMVDTIRAMASAGCPSIAGVSVGPGLITFERIWRSLRSNVQVRTKERSAAFVAP